jgi:hypothetical protein
MIGLRESSGISGGSGREASKAFLALTISSGCWSSGVFYDFIRDMIPCG